MKIKKIFVILSVLSVLCCSCSTHSKEEQSSKNNNITDFIGDWQSIGDENVTFRIDEGKIYYYDTDQEFDCRIDGDSLYIYYDGDAAPSSFYTVLKEDTMICGEEEYRYVRVRY